ncbi:DUF6194 family protein [Tessaracoccus coleopterorum]|uniref:DUF6194 family protein n=1 Tax=Tessaracoccus coleopterorum TaxID=2714950 RepID=UPI0038CD2E3C
MSSTTRPTAWCPRTGRATRRSSPRTIRRRRLPTRRPDRWRLNIHVGTQRFTELLGYPPAEIDAASIDYSLADAFIPHPLYGAYGWVSIVNPAPATTARVLELLREAHLADRRRVERRAR